MTAFTLSSTVRRPYDRTLAAVRDALAGQGFGILTEIDLKATLKSKLDVDVQPEIILGACRPALAYRALRAEPSIAAVLPCNVVVRSVDAETTVVEAFDPSAMIALAGTTTLNDVAAEARTRLAAALAVVEQEN
ncbi:DUF302 domain-containing protein [Kribbella sp. NBC_00889]|uniref:DUF302 domain-containing protein n=1 Tax=Kribbella sp. NBC_00889 TaxID=2975974 RepID=UPI00386B958C|nr:DUF302 domain-containing protein [Kribbella sp. NBC_00889]